MNFEEQYQDVLQNIEFAIVNFYHRHEELLDFDVETVLTALIRVYKAEQAGRPVTLPRLNNLRQGLHDDVKIMCDWRLGRAKPEAVDTRTRMPDVPPIRLDEMVDCLKRIRKSVQKWSKQGGRQGYLSFVEQFIG
jgi:hypothetical protein